MPDADSGRQTLLLPPERETSRRGLVTGSNWLISCFGEISIVSVLPRNVGHCGHYVVPNGLEFHNVNTKCSYCEVTSQNLFPTSPCGRD